MTRILWSRRQLERADASNDGTIVLGVGPGVQLGVRPGLHAGPPPDGSFEDLFRAHYPAIRDLLDGRREPGLALLVASSDGIEASGWFAAKDDVVNTSIVGRHSCADVFLPSDPRLSLRHLALVLHRSASGGCAAFRVLSLRTPVPMMDEERTPLEAVEARGPVLLECASLALLLFPTGGDTQAWPADPKAAWSRIPERVYVDKMPPEPRPDPARGVSVRAVASSYEGSTVPTLVTTFAGPVFPSLALDESDPPRGEILVSSACGRVAVRLGARAARRGVLLGRYDRCDTAGLPVLSDTALSRVHLLVLELDGALWGIDTASRNGTWCDRNRVRAVRIEPGLRLSLAGKATVEWRPFH